LKVELDSDHAPALKQEASQLAVAIGAALGQIKSNLATIDLLAEKKEEADKRSRNPMKHGYAVAAVMVALMFVWYSILLMRTTKAEETVQKQTTELDALQKDFSQANSNVTRLTEISQTLGKLDNLSTNRFLWAAALNAFQYTVVDNFQMVRLQIGQQLTQTKAVPAVTNVNKVVIPGKPGGMTEHTTFKIQAKSFAKPSAAESFMEAVAASPWFKANLRAEEPVRLIESQAPLVDPSDPSKVTILFTVECYAEHKF
jgi:hypothetical protein